MSKPRIEEEKETIAFMIHLYCRHKHKGGELCAPCKEVLDYAMARLDRCPFQENKSTCKLCKIHCYKPEMRERIRVIMRYSGPRMMFYHPVCALKHLWREMAG